MRQVIDSKDVIADDANEAKRKRALALKNNSSIKSANSDAEVPVVKKTKTKAIVEEITAESLLQKVEANNGIYSENSSKRKNFSFLMNHFHKAAVYIISKQNGTTLQETIESDTMANIVKQAKALGMTEEIVKSLIENRTVK